MKTDYTVGWTDEEGHRHLIKTKKESTVLALYDAIIALYSDIDIKEDVSMVIRRREGGETKFYVVDNGLLKEANGRINMTLIERINQETNE